MLFRSEVKEIRMFLFSDLSGKPLAPSQEIAEAKWVPIRNVAEECGSIRDRAWFATVYDRVWEAVQRD